jgi:hypothetical protein
MGFEPTTSVSERVKTFHALDRAAIVMGIMKTFIPENEAARLKILIIIYQSARRHIL